MATDAPESEQRTAWGQLMRAAQAGERASYDRLLREITPFIRALARRRCHNHADVEEMVQDTLLTVHRVRHTYDPGRPFQPWLAAIASRRVIDTLRHRQRVSRFETQTPDQQLAETFTVSAANNELEELHSAKQVGELLRQLPPRQRQALEALKLKELSLAEAALASGQTVGALKVNVHRAMKALRGLMQARQRD